jgi:hypothetical protein
LPLEISAETFSTTTFDNVPFSKNRMVPVCSTTNSRCRVSPGAVTTSTGRDNRPASFLSFTFDEISRGTFSNVDDAGTGTAVGVGAVFPLSLFVGGRIDDGLADPLLGATVSVFDGLQAKTLAAKHTGMTNL